MRPCLAILSAFVLAGCATDDNIRYALYELIPPEAKDVKVLLYDSDATFFMASYKTAKPTDTVVRDYAERLNAHYALDDQTSYTLSAEAITSETTTRIMISTCSNSNKVTVLKAEIDSESERQYFDERVKRQFSELSECTGQ